jgi:hypothetical protein
MRNSKTVSRGQILSCPRQHQARLPQSQLHHEVERHTRSKIEEDAPIRHILFGFKIQVSRFKIALWSSGCMHCGSALIHLTSDIFHQNGPRPIQLVVVSVAAIAVRMVMATSISVFQNFVFIVV